MSQTPPMDNYETVIFGDLSERQALFIREYMERGCRPGDAADAAVAAGYARPGCAGRAAARSRAYELLRNPKVLAALRNELTRKLTIGAALGVQTLMDLCHNARSEQVRFSAARELVDRGHGPVVSRSANINASTSVEDLLARLNAQEHAEAQSAVIEGEAEQQEAGLGNEV